MTADLVRPAVLVGLPVYNGEQFLMAAIDSVLAQRGWQVRIVAVDDASVDGSLALLHRLAQTEPRLVVHHFETNRGVAAARNLAVASGDEPLLAFIDQDDVWSPDRLDIGWAALRQAPELDFVLAHQAFRKPAASLPPWFRQRWLEGPQAGHVLGTFLGWRARTWDQYGPLDETLRMVDDMEWLVRLKDAGVRSVMLDDVVLSRGVHRHNASGNTLRTRDEILRLLRSRHSPGTKSVRG